MFVSKVVRVAAALGVVLAASSALAGNVVAKFDLYNHPDGNVEPSAYGMRIAGFGGDRPATFSFEDGSGKSTMRLTVESVGWGLFRLNFAGTVQGNSADGGTDFGSFALNVSYLVFGGSSDNGWSAYGFNGSTIGSLMGNDGTNDANSPLSDGDAMRLSARTKQHHFGEVFSFAPDGHRLDGHELAGDTWVGRGWFRAAMESSGYYRGGYNHRRSKKGDWLFMAVHVVPLPTSGVLGLAGLGLIAGVRRRR